MSEERTEAEVVDELMRAAGAWSVKGGLGRCFATGRWTAVSNRIFDSFDEQDDFTDISSAALSEVAGMGYEIEDLLPAKARKVASSEASALDQLLRAIFASQVAAIDNELHRQARMALSLQVSEEAFVTAAREAYRKVMSEREGAR